MERPILKIGHPLLRQMARPVPPEELRQSEMQTLIDDMIDTMRAASGAGLAAPQVGQGVRICVAEMRANERYPSLPELGLRVWVNPSIEVLSAGPRVTMYEGCLSVPGYRARVSRPAHIRVSSLDRHGNPQVDEFRSVLAAVAGHEIDHLDGLLFVDQMEDKTLCSLAEYAEFVPKSERIEFVDPEVALPRPDVQ
jgi:peptide deformylase